MLDPQRQDRYGSYYEILFPDFPTLVVKPRYIRIYQSVGNHDIVELYYQNFNPFLYSALKTGVPFKLTWRNDKVNDTLFGYVSHVSHVHEQTLRRGVKIVGVGAGYPLKEIGRAHV